VQRNDLSEQAVTKSVRGGLFRRARGVMILLVAASPAAFIAESGCSDSSSSSGGSGVDPGGVYGAEVTVTVVGRGRVTTSIPGVACPGVCASRFIFKNPTEPGASAGVKLNAVITSSRVRFGGWKFEAVPLGTRGRGGENCNPVVRDSTVAAVDTQALEISVPFGTVQGRAPAGQEGACAGSLDVPLAYNVTATFIDEAIIDAGPDVVDGGGDAGADVLYQAPVAGAVAREIGFAGGALYWRWDSAGNSGISYVTTPSTVATPQTIVSPVTPISLVSIPPTNSLQGHVLYQTSGGALQIIQGGGNAPISAASANTCVAMFSDFSYVFCRSAAGVLQQWTSGGSGPTTLYTTLPMGTDLFASTSNFYFSDVVNGTIQWLPRTVADAGTAGNVTVNGQTGPSGLTGNTSRIFWLNTPSVGVGQAQSATATTVLTSANTMVPASNGVKLVTPDPSSSTYAYAVVGSAIQRVYYTGAIAPTTIRTGLTSINGLAVDSSYVYWTQNDGRVYRALKQ
jgi:hypothetical protein